MRLTLGSVASTAIRRGRGAIRRADDFDTNIDVLATEVGLEEAQMAQTIAEAWEQKGWEKGWEKGWRESWREGWREGLLEGMRKFLVRQVRGRFGELPASVLARIEGADEATLERWCDELLDAPSLAALFAST